MKKWFYKMEYKHPNWCIRNLMLTIIGGQILVYLASMMMPQLMLDYQLSLLWSEVMRGQVWRLLTFVFVPPAASPIFIFISWYCDWLIGHTLESTWGDFKFNAYYLIGMVGAILAAAVTGYGTNLYLNTSLFFAFAVLYPDTQFRLFFLLPVKAKWLALVSGAFYLWDILFGSWSARLSIMLSLAAFLVFFGGDFIKQCKREIGFFKTRMAWRRNNKK